MYSDVAAYVDGTINWSTIKDACTSSFPDLEFSAYWYDSEVIVVTEYDLNVIGDGIVLFNSHSVRNYYC